MKATNTALVLSMLASIHMLPACALDAAKYVTSEEVTGIVTEAGTGKPLPGAVVAIRFKRSNTGHSGEHCFRSMAVETDAEGRFRFAPWKLENTRANATLGEVTVYKRGYAQPVQPAYVRQESRSITGIAFSDTIHIPKTQLQLSVGPFHGTDEERVQQLRSIAANYTCRWQAESDDRVLLPRIREEIASTSLAHMKPPGWDTTMLNWIDHMIRVRGPS
jgi:hypothetical protein